MTLQKCGGIAAITLAFTYIFGFVLFFGILDSSGYETPEHMLEFLIQNRDTFYLGYLVIGILFSFTLIILVQALYRRLEQYSPELMKFSAVVGYIWASIVLASGMIFLVSLSALTKYHTLDPELALTINRTINIIINALGGGIELIGAVWVLAISYTGIKNRIYNNWLHYWGIFVGSSGVLTLFSGFSFLSSNPIFEVMTAIFGLGQILWFIGLGIVMLRESSSYK